ncbi:MAG TPA: cytochrome b/b6 domain-containing protein [Salinisphaeraceae bacterium]|nr:cytochrome b/b6 domain-containing protein [Salinisphaeraceae bacterium]
MSNTNSRHNLQQEKVWDPVSRLWHWAFAIAVIGNWYLGKFMTFDTIRWHFYTGFFILGLLAFRLLWGFIGPAPVRFKTFWPSPARLFRYLRSVRRREPSGARGHNPLGALSVYAMLLVIAGQAISGLFIESDDFFETAPLHGSVSTEIARFMSKWHHTLPVLILILILLHVAAILFYLFWKRENLAKSMVTGWKWVRRQ